MAPPEDFDTSSQEQVVRSLLEQIMSPEMANFLSGSVAKGLDGVTNNTLNLPGGMSIPLGAGAMFSGPRAVEMQAASMFMNRAISNNFSQAASVAEGLRMDIRDGISQSLFGVPSASSGISLTNMASDFFVYNSLGLQQLEAQMQNAGTYMGVAPPFLSSNSTRTERINNNFRTLSALVTADVGYNPSNFGGMSGGDIGTVVSEMARTGAFSGMNLGTVATDDVVNFVQGNGEDAIEGPLRQQLQGLRERIQASTRVIGEFQRVFQTDVAGAIDRMNQLFGVDVMQTLSPDRLNDISRTIPATAMATGFTSQQIMSLSSSSMQAAQQMGFRDFMGAHSTGVLSAQMFRAATQTGENPFAFINERSFREQLVRRATSAATSGDARAISGAVAILQRTGGDVEGFLDRVQNMDGSMSVSSIAAEAGLTSSQVMAASYSQEARRWAESGRGTVAALSGEAGFMGRLRAGTVRRVLRMRGMSNTQIDGILAGVDGPLTSRAIRSALEGVEGGGGIADQLDQIFYQNAQARGFRNVEEADLFLATARNNENLAAIFEQTEGLKTLQERIGGATNTVGGFRAISEMVTAFQGGDGEDKMTLRNIIQTATGATNIDEKVLQGMFGAGGSFDLRDKTDTRANVLRKLAVGAASSVLFGGRLGNRQASADEMELAKKLFSATTEEEREKILKEFEQKVKEDPALKGEAFDLAAAEQEQALRETVAAAEGKAVKDVTLSGRQITAARDLAFLDQFDKVDDLMSVGGSRNDKGEITGDEVDFRARLAKLRDRIKGAAERNEELELTSDEKKLLAQARREGNINDQIAGSSASGMQTLVDIATSILEVIQNSDISSNKKGEKV